MAAARARTRSFATALAGLLVACGAPAPQARNAAFFEAMGRLDLPAANDAAANDDERRAAAVLAKALAGGSPAAFDDLVALGSTSGDTAVRAWARQSLLDLLRLECRWDRLASLRTEHPQLELSDRAIPAVMTRLPVPAVDVAPEPVVLPFAAEIQHHAAVSVHAAGDAAALDFVAVVDTGAGSCVIDDETGERLGVRLVEGAVQAVGIAGAHTESRYGVLRELRFGAVTAREVPVVVLARQRLRELAGEVAGLIGWEILQHVAVEFAGASRQLVVRRSAGAAPAAEPNLVLLHEPVVRLHSGETPLLLLLDTGSGSTEMRLSLAERLGWPTTAGGEAVAGLGGGEVGQVRRLASVPIRCGRVQLDLGGVAAVERPSPRERILRIDGTLGMDVAFAVRVVVDGPARTVSFRTD